MPIREAYQWCLPVYPSGRPVREAHQGGLSVMPISDAYQGCLSGMPLSGCLYQGCPYQGCFLAHAGMLSSMLVVAGLGK